MKKCISPSLMCVDFFSLAETVKTFENCAIDFLHIDVMDGAFVPNFALGTDFVRQLKAKTNIPLDLHLMTEYPERHLAAFDFGEGDIVSIHAEATKHIDRTLSLIKERKAKAFLALNPATPLDAAREVIGLIDGLLVMTVNPGFAGQKMVPYAIDKIARARAFLNEHGREDALIEVDGNVSIENAVRMNAAGADIFVLGTSAVFCGNDIAKNIETFRRSVF